MKTIIIQLIVCLTIFNTKCFGQRHTIHSMVPKFRNIGILNSDEQDAALIHFSELKNPSGHFYNLIKTDSGYSLTRDGFDKMLKTMKIFEATPSEKFGIRIYPAFNDYDGMYLVFMGENLENYPKKIKTDTAHLFTLVADNISQTTLSDLKEVDPKFSQKVRNEIRNFIRNFGGKNELNVKSLDFSIKQFRLMLINFDNQKPNTPDDNIKAIRFFPCYDSSRVKNKLYLVGQEEITSSNLTDRKINDRKIWFNHMEPCPDECPDNQILPRDQKTGQ